ncbi:MULTISPECIES: GvpL/GvpF family gas vesicle protein [unclassified Streptomyces]|uniref:GvpL/GvpF family gas vesicle protein n=1 Tax=unclassified Streptomyces TaxID=2593676 RepID=UPI002DDACD65|nr:GvpL/GvpF family gas vesicle protein [Streptomyces sp. NBC_01445]WSE03538.1 GvpL/GvpF family gas vesicle protein [Streptomyces sp. NBC_01445]
MSELVTYAYAVARDADGLAEYAATLSGVGESVALVTSDRDASIVLVVSRVGADDFQEAALKRHLEDMAWLEAVARAHHSVIDALATRTDVLPLRLATVYLDNARAREVLDDRAAVFDEQLTRLAGHVEWGVKIYADPSAPTPAPATAEAGALSPGRAYLLQRKAQKGVRDQVYRAAQQAAERVELAGRRFAVGRARHRVQQGDLATTGDENVLNDAYLVSMDHAESFRSEAARAAEGLQGVRVEITGPWAPYSFAAASPGSDPPMDGPIA